MMVDKKNGGFLEELIKDAAMFAAVQASKNDKGKPDLYKAVGMAAGMGYTSFDDTMRVGAMLRAEGAFDNE